MPTTEYFIIEPPKPIMFASNFSEYLGTVLSGDFNALAQWGKNERVDCFLPENIAEAIREIELIRAEPDHYNFGNACLLRGYLYQNDGNREQAINSYNQAVERGNSMAMVKLAEIYMSNTEAKIDNPKVSALLDQAIELGNDHAMVQRALMYEEISGGAVNYDRAVALYEQAINLGNADAMYYLANMHEKGLGGDVNSELAVDLYVQAIALGHEDAMFRRADMHESEKNYLEAIRLHKTAYEQMSRYSLLTPELKSAVDSGQRKKINSLARKALNEGGVPGGTILLNHTDITAAKEQFNGLIQEVVKIIENLQIKTRSNPKYDSVFIAAERLHDQLFTYSMNFFYSPTPEVFKQFTTETKRAISEAETIFSEHRGVWQELHPILKGILGVLATLSLVPALIVAVGTKQGYVNTFFATPKTETRQQLDLVKEKYEEQEDAIVDAYVNNLAR